VKLPFVIQQDASLKRFNTFGVEARTKWLLRVQDLALLPELLERPEWKELPMLPLGAGSNVLFTQDFDGVVVHYDSQEARRPVYAREIASGLAPGIALEDGVAARYDDERLVEVVSARPDGRAFHVDSKGERPIAVRVLF